MHAENAPRHTHSGADPCVILHSDMLQNELLTGVCYHAPAYAGMLPV